MSNEADISGRVALVTGASGGIGAAIARALAIAGTRVAVGYASNRQSADEVVEAILAAGGNAQAFDADMADPSAPAHLVKQVAAAMGPVEILVPSHGLARQARYEDLDAGAFDRTVAVNLRAPFLLAQQVLPGMRKQRFGRVLFVSSLAGIRGGVVGPDYAASKAGLHGLTHFLAARVAADGVTVNALAPGFVETAMLPGFPDELGQSVPVGRVGQPSEVADLALAIVRNGYLTSKVLAIDGGMHPC